MFESVGMRRIHTIDGPHAAGIYVYFKLPYNKFTVSIIHPSMKESKNVQLSKGNKTKNVFS